MLKFLRDEEGQGMVEYGLLLGLIAIAVIAVLVVLGPRIANMFGGVNDALPEITTGSYGA